MSYIYQKNLERFFNSQRRKTSESDHLAIIRRIDLDGDSKINKEEFLETIKPQEPYSKMLVRQRLTKKVARIPLKHIDDNEKSRKKVQAKSASRLVKPKQSEDHMKVF
jgi:hypothetical protein